MSDSPPTPDDLLVSAVLDGIASPDEVQRVASDPRLTARLAEFRAVAEAVGGPVPLVDTAKREAHLARALAEGVPLATTAPSPPPPPVDLARVRAGRNRPRSTTILSVAAAIVLALAAGALLVRLGDSVGTSSDDSASSAGDSRDVTAADGAGADEGSRGAESVEGDDTEAGATEAPSSPPSTTAGEAEDGLAADVDPALPDLGTFTKAEDLASRVQGELILEPSPDDLSATGQSFATTDTCLDDFGVDVVLLGRATLEGEEGLVYVESSTGSGRRLWLVDPSVVATDGTCRQITPVQTI